MIRQWALFLASIPLAVAGNIARIVTIAVMAEAFGGKVALGLYHDYSGYILFTASITMMVLLSVPWPAILVAVLIMAAGAAFIASCPSSAPDRPSAE